jgi:hypothetical protein
MSDRIRCHCRRCTIKSLMGPAVVITVGVLFLLQQSRIGFSFGQTWPIILVVIGVISLASALAPMDGHIDVNQPLPPNPPVASAPPIVPPPSSSDPFPRQGQ